VLRTIVNFVENVEPTFGGDAPECYELVLHEAQSFAWMDGWSHVLVLIGDDGNLVNECLLKSDNYLFSATREKRQCKKIGLERRVGQIEVS
jgi:hypothetical protein